MMSSSQISSISTNLWSSGKREAQSIANSQNIILKLSNILLQGRKNTKITKLIAETEVIAQFMTLKEAKIPISKSVVITINLIMKKGMYHLRASSKEPQLSSFSYLFFYIGTSIEHQKKTRPIAVKIETKEREFMKLSWGLFSWFSRVQLINPETFRTTENPTTKGNKRKLQSPFWNPWDRPYLCCFWSDSYPCPLITETTFKVKNVVSTTKITMTIIRLSLRKNPVSSILQLNGNSRSSSEGLQKSDQDPTTNLKCFTELKRNVGSSQNAFERQTNWEQLSSSAPIIL